MTVKRKSFACDRDKKSEYHTTTTRSQGCRPRNQAGRATDAHRGFSERGGMVMIKRRTSPQATCDSLSVTASRCQLGLKTTPGRTTLKANSVKDVDSGQEVLARSPAVDNRPSGQRLKWRLKSLRSRSAGLRPRKLGRSRLAGGNNAMSFCRSTLVRRMVNRDGGGEKTRPALDFCC